MAAGAAAGQLPVLEELREELVEGEEAFTTAFGELLDTLAPAVLEEELDEEEAISFPFSLEEPLSFLGGFSKSGSSSSPPLPP